MSGGFYFDMVVRHGHSYIMKTPGWLLVKMKVVLASTPVSLCLDSGSGFVQTPQSTHCISFFFKFILRVVEAMECVVDPPLISHPLSVSKVTRFKEQAVYKHLLTHLAQTFICWACGKHLHGARRRCTQ